MANIKIMALGGLGEQGKNMYVIEINNNIFVLDAGIKYPEIDMYGVDAVVPDISYLIKNKKTVYSTVFFYAVVSIVCAIKNQSHCILNSCD